MHKNNNYYWYKEKPSSTRQIIGRLIAPFIALIVIFAIGIRPAFSESNSTVGLDYNFNESPIITDLPNIEPKIVEKDGKSVSTENNSAIISDGQVSVKVNDTNEADISQSGSNISITIENSSSSETESLSGTSVQPNIVINGEEVSIPDNGRVRQTLRDEHGTTRLRTDINSGGSSTIRIDASSNF